MRGIVNIANIQDEHSLREWLKTQTPEVAAWIAERAALRLLPYYWDFLLTVADTENDLTVLPVLRFFLSSTVARHATASNEISTALANARSIANASTEASSHTYDDNAHNIALVSGYASVQAIGLISGIDGDKPKAIKSIDIGATISKSSSFWASINADYQAIEERKQLETLPLFPDNANWQIRLWDKVRDQLKRDKATKWSFWIEWYAGVIAGDEPNWDMYRDTVLIDDVAWEAGPNRINLEIQHNLLEAEFKKRMDSFDTATREKHKLEAPAKLWEDKRKEHSKLMKKAECWFNSSLSVMVILIAVVLALALFFRSQVAGWFLPLGCGEKTDFWSNMALVFNKAASSDICSNGGSSPIFWVTVLAVLTIITLLMWFIRLKMKEYLSERHLKIDARERQAFIEAYIGLIADANVEVGVEERAIVFGAIFRPSSDGIVKEDGGIDPSISALVSKLLAK